MGGVLAVTLLAGCTSGPENTEATATITTPAVTPLGPLESFESPYGVCQTSMGILAGEDSPLFAEAARKCLDLYKGAEIALVNYGMDTDDAQSMADRLDKRVESSSEGKLSVTVTVVQPSSEAEKLFQEQNSDNCVDANDVWRYGSYVGSAVMPELVQYDSIIGVSNLESCDGSAAGVASPNYSGRYAEVFDAADKWQAIEDNGGSNVRKTDQGNGFSTVENFQDPADIAAHEWLHVIGLGHAGELFSEGGNLGGQALLGSQTEAQIDLDAYISSGVFREYGDDTNVMGRVSGLREDTLLTTVQQYLLAWPELALGEDAPVTVQDISQQEVTFTADSARDSIAILNLPNPVSMPTGGYSSSTDFGESQKFDTLAFVPRFDEEYGGVAYGTEVYLTSQDNSTASLGLLYCYNDSGNCQYNFVVGGQKVAAVFSETGVSLRIEP